MRCAFVIMLYHFAASHILSLPPAAKSIQRGTRLSATASVSAARVGEASAALNALTLCGFVAQKLQWALGEEAAVQIGVASGAGSAGCNVLSLELAPPGRRLRRRRWRGDGRLARDPHEEAEHLHLAPAHSTKAD